MHGKGVGWGCPVCVNCIIIIVPPEKRDGGAFDRQAVKQLTSIL
jgi:hypothetical protein